MKLAWIAGATAAAVVVAAAADAVRREESVPRADAAPQLQGEAAALTSLGARGALILGDGVCSNVRLTLPTLEHEVTAGCLPAGVVSPRGTQFARCVDDQVEVVSTDGRLQRRVAGCAPAWRPDGALTVARGGAVVRAGACATCGRVLISRAELERAARRHPRLPERAQRVRALIDHVAWLSNDRAVVNVSIRTGRRIDAVAPLSAVAYFRNGRMEDTPPYFRATGGRLAASPRGSYVTLTPDVILRPDGTEVGLPEHLRDIRAFAWSRDERFLALATRASVVVVPVASLEQYDRIGGGLRSVTILQGAADLAWR